MSNGRRLIEIESDQSMCRFVCPFADSPLNQSSPHNLIYSDLTIEFCFVLFCIDSLTQLHVSLYKLFNCNMSLLRFKHYGHSHRKSSAIASA